MTSENPSFEELCAALEKMTLLQVAVLVRTPHEDKMLAVFRGVLRGPSDELSSPPHHLRFVVDDGQGIGSYDETSFILDGTAFEWGRIRRDDTVEIVQHDAKFTITVDQPKTLPIKLGS
jgi:hypothetical protein